jgi:hypothetical protein
MTEPSIISWRAGKRWAGWHLAASDFDGPFCGIDIPPGAPRCVASSSSGPLLLGDLCKNCLRVLADEPAPKETHERIEGTSPA